MAETPGIAARVFSALAEAGINVIATAQGSSELNLSLVVDGKEAPRAQRVVHAAFQLSKIGGGAVAHPERSDVVLLASGRSGGPSPHDREGEAGRAHAPHRGTDRPERSRVRRGRLLSAATRALGAAKAKARRSPRRRAAGGPAPPKPSRSWPAMPSPTRSWWT